MRTALVLLSDRDTDAPQLGGIATVSKDDPADHGGYALGVAAAKRGALWVDRPYFTGNPDPSAILTKAKQVKAAGGLVQLGNEPNLPLEGWQGGAAAYAAFFHQLDAVLPGTFLYAPMSPGIPGWQEWISPMERAYAVHAYGDRAQMQAVVQWYLDHTAGTLYVTEVNFGAGQVVDRDRWAKEQLAPFLAWCQTQPRIQLVAYFAWRWDQSPKLPTSVDATPSIVAVLQGVKMYPDRYPDAVWIGSPNDWPDRAGQRILAVVDHIAQGGESAIDSTFQDTAPGGDPNRAVSAHFAVDVDGKVHQYVSLNGSAWANGIIEQGATLPPGVPPGVDPNRYTVSIEHAGFSGQPLTDAQYQATLKLHRWLLGVTGLAPTRDTIIGHYRISPRSRPNCPGSAFPWERLMADLTNQTTPPTPAEPLADSDFRQYAPKTGTWREVAVNLKGVCDDALNTGRANRDQAQKIVDGWGKR